MHYRTFRRTVAYAIGLALSLWTSSALADSTQQFVDKASALNDFLVQSASLAQTKAADPATRAFAQETAGVVNDADKDLKSAAKALGAAEPSSAPAQLTQALAALHEVPAAEFDAAYVSAQITSYAEIGRLYQAFIKNGTAGEIRAYAEATYPELRMLEVRAQSLSSPAAVTDGQD
jgi:putative membrane protein